jgi:hypothetical protein
MNGVPFVGNGRGFAMENCPGYLTVASEQEHIETLNRLMSDHDFYSRTATSYRDYVAKTYTYEAFNNNLNKILTDRGIE